MQHLTYRALERITVPRPVDRLQYIQRLASGLFVYDLGALDETALHLKQASGDWLHSRLCGTAKQVLGIDNSDLVPPGGMVTNVNGQIIRGDIFDLAPVVEKYGCPDVIVAGELIEHLPNTEALLLSLKRNRALHGTQLVLSTPNACCWHNFLVGLAARESTHQDHLQIYSYKTLRTLFARTGIELTALVPYYARFHEMIALSSGPRKLGVTGFEKSVNALEWAAPMLSAGWIAMARI